MANGTAVTGPVEWVALGFPGTKLANGIGTALAELIDVGNVRLIDAAVIHKSADGVVTGAELEAEDGATFTALDGDVLELMSEDDLLTIAVGLQADTTTLVLVWENRWASAFGEAVSRLDGTLVASDRVPREAVERALAAVSGTTAEVAR